MTLTTYLLGALRRVVHQADRWHSRRRAMLWLEGQPDWMLKDIAVGRSEIGAVVGYGRSRGTATEKKEQANVD